MIKILLADDHNLFREGLVTMLKKQKDFLIVSQAEDGRDIEKKYTEVYPDVIISDISMPIKSGPEAIKVLTTKYKNVKVLFLSQFTGDDYIYSIIKSGGLGLISKNCMQEELIYAIREVAKGNKYFMNKSPKELDTIITRFESIYLEDIEIKEDPLTPKENEILSLIGEGLTSEQIAEKLKLSRRTVDTHRTRIINTLGFNSSTELIRYAVIKNMNASNK